MAVILKDIFYFAAVVGIGVSVLSAGCVVVACLWLAIHGIGEGR